MVWLNKVISHMITSFSQNVIRVVLVDILVELKREILIDENLMQAVIWNQKELQQFPGVKLNKSLQENI